MGIPAKKSSSSSTNAIFIIKAFHNCGIDSVRLQFAATGIPAVQQFQTSCKGAVRDSQKGGQRDNDSLDAPSEARSAWRRLVVLLALLGGPALLVPLTERICVHNGVPSLSGTMT